MKTLDMRLAEHAASLRYEQIPDQAIEKAKIFILDSLGVGVAGGSVPESALMMQTIQRWGEGQSVSVWGQQQKLPMGQGIMMNAFQIHCQEFDCLHEGAVLHAMATLLPTLIAECEARSGVSGKQLITAVVAGVDVACYIGVASKLGLRFFRPATSGGFGAVAGLANLRGYDSHTTLQALGHQLGQVSGTMQAHTEGSAVLPLQVAFNARAAMQSCDLAQSGITGLQQPITGKFGYLPMFESEWALQPHIDGLGSRWMINELSHKPFPSGRATHGGIEGLMTLRELHGFGPDEVSEIVVRGPSLINHLVNRPPLPEPGPNYARLCMPFALAKVLQHGAPDPSHYRGDELTDSRTFELSRRVRMEKDDNPDPNALSPQRVTVKLKDGRELSHDIPSMLASPTRPLVRERQLRKFLRCWDLSALPLGDPQGLIDRVDRLEALQDVNSLVSFMRPQQPT